MSAHGGSARADAGVVVHAVQYPPAHMLDSGLWQLSHGLADLGLTLLLVVVVLISFSGHVQVSNWLATLVPTPIRSYFTSEHMKATPWVERAQPKPAQAIGHKIARQSRAIVRPAVARFGIGSTKAEVRAIQGPPTEAGENIWSYGPSRVYFVEGRVATWYGDPERPLRAE